ncbi:MULTISPECIES: NDUFA4 family protein [Halorussus]|nr:MULTISPECIES: NDUFA4 family protein [Halorussus]
MPLLPLHAGHAGGLDPVAVLVGAALGVAVWQGIRLLATRDDRAR